MTRDEQINAMWAKIEAGTMTHDDAADLFMMTMAGQSTGVSRAEVLARMRSAFPSEQALNGYLGILLPKLQTLIAGLH